MDMMIYFPYKDKVSDNLENLIDLYNIGRTDVYFGSQRARLNVNDNLEGLFVVEQKNADLLSIDDLDKYMIYLYSENIGDLSLIKIPVNRKNIDKRIEKTSERFDIDIYQPWKIFI